MQSLAEASAVVTGATSGIGQTIALKLHAAGVRVALVARAGDRLEQLARQLDAAAFIADLSNGLEVQALTRQLEMHFGDTPDILVNAAGAFGLAPIAEMESGSFDAMLAVNLRAPFLLMRAFLPGMLARRSGHIVSIGSVAGRQALTGNGAYSASKYGLRGLHEVLALELKGSGVRATLIEPSATDTPLWHAIDRGRHPELPAPGEMLSAEAVADCVLFALSTPQPATVSFLGIERT